MSIEAMKLALESLEDWKTYMLGHWDVIDEQAVTSLRQAIADAELERVELIGHADLAINNIYIFNGYGEDVPEGRTPIYAGYKTTKEKDT